MRKSKIQAGIAQFLALPKRKSQFTFWIATRLPYWLMGLVYSIVGILNSPIIWGFVTALVIGLLIYLYTTAK